MTLGLGGVREKDDKIHHGGQEVRGGTWSKNDFVLIDIMLELE